MCDKNPKKRKIQILADIKKYDDPIKINVNPKLPEYYRLAIRLTASEISLYQEYDDNTIDDYEGSGDDFHIIAFVIYIEKNIIKKFMDVFTKIMDECSIKFVDFNANQTFTLFDQHTVRKLADTEKQHYITSDMDIDFIKASYEEIKNRKDMDIKDFEKLFNVCWYRHPAIKDCVMIKSFAEEKIPELEKTLNKKVTLKEFIKFERSLPLNEDDIQYDKKLTLLLIEK